MNLTSGLAFGCRCNLVLVLALAAIGNVEGQGPTFVRIGGVPGDTTVPGMGGGWIRVGQPYSAERKSYTITVKKGRAAELLEKALKAETLFAEATLIASRPRPVTGGDTGEQTYLAIKLENVRITSYQLGAVDARATLTFARAVPLTVTPSAPRPKDEGGHPVILKVPGVTKPSHGPGG